MGRVRIRTSTEDQTRNQGQLSTPLQQRRPPLLRKLPPPKRQQQHTRPRLPRNQRLLHTRTLLLRSQKLKLQNTQVVKSQIHTSQSWIARGTKRAILETVATSTKANVT